MSCVHPDSLRWRPDDRCTACTHRTGRDSRAARQTRELPVILWPFEVAGRIEARIRGRLARRGRL